jgi:hypothetical protein
MLLNNQESRVDLSVLQKRTDAGLQSGRDFVIPDKREQATDASDFELITWLVIKSGETDG